MPFPIPSICEAQYPVCLAVIILWNFQEPSFVSHNSHTCCPNSKIAVWFCSTQFHILPDFCISRPEQFPSKLCLLDCYLFHNVGAIWKMGLLLNRQIPEKAGDSQGHYETNKNLVIWQEFIRIINTACYLRVISDSFLAFILLFLSVAKILLLSA